MSKSPIPANSHRHPRGCPDADWCRGNRECYWDCQGSREALREANERKAFREANQTPTQEQNA